MIHQLELIDKNEFVEVVKDENFKAFVAYIRDFVGKMAIYSARKAWIFSISIEKITILSKYLDFADVLLKKSAKVLFK